MTRETVYILFCSMVFLSEPSRSGGERTSVLNHMTEKRPNTTGFRIRLKKNMPSMNPDFCFEPYSAGRGRKVRNREIPGCHPWRPGTGNGS